MTVISAKNLILGRMASVIAKRALLGETIELVNCEDAVITGNRLYFIQHYAKRRQRGTPTQGPFTPRRPDLFVKRAIRGMIPYKRPRGRDALSRIKCHIGMPVYLEGKQVESIEQADSARLPNYIYVSVKEICRSMGAKI